MPYIAGPGILHSERATKVCRILQARAYYIAKESQKYAVFCMPGHTTEQKRRKSMPYFTYPGILQSKRDAKVCRISHIRAYYREKVSQKYANQYKIRHTFQ